MLDMGLIKIEVNVAEIRKEISKTIRNRTKIFEDIAKDVQVAVGGVISEFMNAEMTLFLGEPDQVENSRNGYESKDYSLKGIGAVRLKIPVDRKRKFNSSIIPKGEKIDPRIKEDLAVLHLAGISKRTMEMISKRIFGVDISRETVSNSLALIEGKALAWLQRPITKKYWALYIDGTNFKIQRRGSVEKEIALAVLGVDENNRKSILAIEPGTKENKDSWDAVFSSLVSRGLDVSAVRIGIMDGLPGLETSFKERFTKAVTARCWVHALKNALNKCPERLRDAFHSLASKVMYATSEDSARRAFIELKSAMQGDGQRAVQILEKDLESLLVHYRFERSLWIPLKTTNPIERINKEFKRRAKSMETMGESTRDILLAFTALRLEMNWRKMPINSKALEKIPGLRDKFNPVEEAVATLLN
jgi:putative transposase